MWDGGTGTGFFGTAPIKINPNRLGYLTAEEAARLLAEDPSEFVKEMLNVLEPLEDEDPRYYQTLKNIPMTI
ncbi:MAG: hypothetical protein J4432_03875 [DPANN group archaeon]|nr:hypothetical protein [DPANN group archaeon]